MACGVAKRRASTNETGQGGDSAGCPSRTYTLAGSEAVTARIFARELVMSDDTNELAALAAQAGMLDTEQEANGPQAMVAQAQAEQQVEQQNANTGQVRMILALAVPILGKLYPCLVDIYDDSTCDNVAATLGPVLTKYNIDLGDMGAKWGPEIAAVMVCGPVAFATYQGIMADIASRKPQVPKAVASNGQKAPEKAPEPVVLG